ncbi:MAG: Fic family protein [Stellaceae bacterium]
MAPGYIWQRDDWPGFRWDDARLLSLLAAARFRQGSLLGTMRTLGFDLRLQSELEATADDVVQTSAIEGELLDPVSVRSSIARRLGLPEGGLAPADRTVEGAVDMILDAVRKFDAPLGDERIFAWHAGLFPTGYSGIHRIDVGAWRQDKEGPMQVVSGAYGRQRVHYEAPPTVRVPAEMKTFMAWFNGGSANLDGLLRAGLAHLWFVTIHPLDDGNGRIARAIADLAIAQTERIGHRFYSMSSQIQRDRAAYYEILEATQRADLDVTEWLIWFAESYARAIDAAEALSRKVIAKAKFWQAQAAEPPFSERQQKVLNRLLDGFDGNMTARKWSSLCGCSMDTAQRDMADLVRRRLLARNPGGSKNTSYRFTWTS